jgi:hypothetical protein
VTGKLDEAMDIDIKVLGGEISLSSGKGQLWAALYSAAK